MRADLEGALRTSNADVRPFSIGDKWRLGVLLFNAYLGTIDQEEDTVEQAHAEIDKTIGGEYGTFMQPYSMVVERSGALHSAALITRFHDRPLLAFSFTDPNSKNQGLARACIRAAMAALRAAGESELHLVVTRANAPAFHLYQALGFQVERDA
jgi:GNAT superfamily N-acetyltransferase